jgi:hypothetical protein
MIIKRRKFSSPYSFIRILSDMTKRTTNLNDFMRSTQILQQARSIFVSRLMLPSDAGCCLFSVSVCLSVCLSSSLRALVIVSVSKGNIPKQ